ncbi:MAG: type IV secretion system DNA-binding domain-containing protein [Candidatus Pacebacteria bacterium]|nr:type IV secretion system DNA-binding domain-containing protein [Candidatus Paceibacterota bacterium]MDD2756997.1 type IV secretion system DNA-binding domain-containing protein [Candidatus Paceibacterota bacterium]MDD3283507.1 type IV secretion system DNA-binding domain-containing protein [Candidatus Paceibacterota bacterium]MDD3969637.1 type IV secretion system DNA-binding domain-containing protein [Candidatus Paceibacterota bacterium]MDD4738023.1 type IV secretion system DNA-binding domain-
MIEYILSGVSLLIVLIVIFLIKRNRKMKTIEQSLKLTLFSVKMSGSTAEELRDSGRQEKDWIRLMEDFYSSLNSLSKEGLFGVDPWIALEIVKLKEDIIFYVAAPRRFENFIEKSIYSIYPTAQVEKSDDYNIFSPTENVCCGYLKTTKPLYLPIKTYNQMDTDPLSSITNIFTKLKTNEEAAVQLIVKKGSNNWYERGRMISNEVAQGKNFIQAMGATNFISTIKGKSEDKLGGSPPDEELLKILGAKLNKDSFETNIRLIVSADSKIRSESIFLEMANSFAQFSSNKTNNFRLIRTKKGAFDELIYKYSFRLFDDSQRNILGIEELTSIFHFPTPLTKTPNIKTVKSKVSVPPTNIPKEGLLLGYNIYREEKKDIHLKKDDRRRHMYIIGQTGTGKSSALSSMALQDIKNGEGMGMLDPHGDLIDDILSKMPKDRIEDVVLFDPTNLERSIGLNMLEYDTRFPEQKTFIVNEMINILDKLYDLRQTGGPMFEQYARNALMLLMDDPNEVYTLMEVPKVLADADFRKRLLLKCKNFLVKEFWEKQAEQAGGEGALKNMVPYITSKFDNFISNDYMRPIIGQTKSTFNFREIIDGKKVFLVNLSKGRLGELNSSLLGLIITSKMSLAAFSRVDIPEDQRNDFYLYMDEFQNFATSTISTILSEARKYRLSLIISHQFIAQLPEEIRDAVFGNVGTIASFRVGAEDSQFLEKEFEPIFNSQDLMNIDNFNFYIKMMIDGQTSKPFNIKTYPPERGNYDLAKDIKEYYSLTYARSRYVVDEEIMRRRVDI